jgi:hypothetical protein
MRHIKTLAVVTALTLAPYPALSQANCAARDVVVEKLKTGYGETFAGGGLRNSTSIFEVWMSEDKGTWTILMTTPDGKSCVMASGTNWRGAAPAEPKGVAG